MNSSIHTGKCLAYMKMDPTMNMYILHRSSLSRSHSEKARPGIHNIKLDEEIVSS